MYFNAHTIQCVLANDIDSSMGHNNKKSYAFSK